MIPQGPKVPPIVSPREPVATLPPVASAKPTPLLRTFELRRAEFVQLFAIDCVEQSFKAQIYIELVLRDGALDDSLAASGDQFPLDDAGKPTFRPPALWYLKQLDFNNASHFHEMEHSTRIIGNDIVLGARFEGVWFENMELVNFPFDCQELTASLSMNVRTTGMTPATFTVPDDADLSLDMEGFTSQQQLWQAKSKLNAISTTVGASEDRKFPTLKLSAVVFRRSGYYVYNIVVPMAFLPLLGAMQFAVPRDNQETRLSVSLSLLLTCAAFKFSISTMMPSVSYLTFIDRYVNGNAFLLMLLVFEGAICGYIELQIGADLAESVDYICLLVFVALYVLSQLHFYVRKVRARSMATADGTGSLLPLASPRGSTKSKQIAVNAPASHKEKHPDHHHLHPVRWLHHSSESHAKAKSRVFSSGMGGSHGNPMIHAASAH